MMKKFLTLLLIVLVFSGCAKSKENTQNTSDLNGFGRVYGAVLAIDLNCNEPYVEIQWTNTFNETVVLKDDGIIKKQVAGTWKEFGDVKKIVSPVENVMIEANTTLKPIRYNVKNYEKNDGGRVLIEFESVDNFEIKATAETIITEKEILITPQPISTPDPTPYPKYVGTDAKPAIPQTFDMYTNISTPVNAEIIALNYINVIGKTRTFGVPRVWTVRVKNFGVAMKIKSAYLYRQLPDGSKEVATNIVNDKENLIILENSAGDLEIPDFCRIPVAGEYRIRIEYVKVLIPSQTGVIEISMTLPEKYAGENFPRDLIC